VGFVEKAAAGLAFIFRRVLLFTRSFSLVASFSLGWCSGFSGRGRISACLTSLGRGRILCFPHLTFALVKDLIVRAKNQERYAEMFTIE
jgi:hypothetical protein